MRRGEWPNGPTPSTAGPQIGPLRGRVRGSIACWRMWESLRAEPRRGLLRVITGQVIRRGTFTSVTDLLKRVAVVVVDVADGAVGEHQGHAAGGVPGEVLGTSRCGPGGPQAVPVVRVRAQRPVGAHDINDDIGGAVCVPDGESPGRGQAKGRRVRRRVVTVVSGQDGHE